MPPLTVLSDSNVKEILNKLTRKNVEDFQESLRQALHEYSTGTGSDGACADHQPERTVVESNSGNTTLFMPSTSSAGIGMKVVTLATPKPPSSPTKSSFEILPSTETLTTCPQGALTIMDNTGAPIGFLNAEEITAFRTALASSLLLIRRSKVKNILVFGVGKQAYWHTRISLLLFGHTIKHVQFINRTFSTRAKEIMKLFFNMTRETKDREGWNDTTFGILTPGYGEYDRLLKDGIRIADVIYTTTPSTKPLFPHEILTNTEGRKRGRLIVAIGSYKAHMIEIPPAVLVQAVKRHSSGHHFHKHAEEGGVVIVDTLSCVTQSGELVQAGTRENQTVELGELVMLERMGEDDEFAISDSPEEISSSIESFSFTGTDTGTPSRSLASIFGSGASISSNPPSRKSSLSLSRKSSFVFHRRSGSMNGTVKMEASPSKSRQGSIGGKSRQGSVSGKSISGKVKKEKEKEDEMCRWLSRGNVVYKSVGMGLMDLVVGAEIVRLARERRVGVVIEGF